MRAATSERKLKTIEEIYGSASALLEDRKRAAAGHPEALLYLMTVTRFDRTGSIAGKEPLGHLILACYLRMAGWDVRVFAGSIYEALALLENRRESDAGRQVFVGLYCDYENMNAITCLAQRISRSLGYRILLGGPQAVALDEAFMRRYPFVDAVIRGDGEHSLCDVLTAFTAGYPEAIHSIRGVCCLIDGVCFDNGISEPVSDLDEVPPTQDTVMIQQGKRTSLSLLSGRGCPFHCAFCYEGGNSKTVRLRSVEHMLREMRLRFQDHPEAKYVYFGDDTFTLQKERLSAFCSAFVQLRREHDFVWFADGHVRVLLQHPEYLPMLQDAGLVRMQIGIESTVQSVIDLYQKNIKKEDLYKTLELCLASGLPQLVGNIIIGGAMETEQTVRETFQTVYDLLGRSRGMLDVTSTLYSHFPGTAISRNPDAFGLRILDPDGVTSFGDYPIAETAGLGRDRIAILRREFITTTARIMKACVDTGEVDEERMLLHSYLSRHYGISNLWLTFGLNAVTRRFYQMKSEYGAELEQLQDPAEMYPTRSTFLHGLLAWSYTEKIPSINGFILSPLEDQLLHWCAGKLTLPEILEKLWPQWQTSFADRAEFQAFVISRLRVLERHRLLVFIGLRGSPVARSLQRRLNSGWELPSYSRERKLNRSEQTDRKDKVILFYPYSVSMWMEMDISGSTLGIFLLGAVLKAKGYEVKTCECVFNQVIERVQSENDGRIRAIGLSLDYENRRLVLRLSRIITEEFGIPVVIGGIDARTLTQDEVADSRAAAVIKGEGEITLPLVLEALDEPRALEEISGLLLIREGALVDTGPEEPPTDLDALPFADYSLSMDPVSGSFFNISTSRGCPNHCAFCHEGTHKTKLRMRSVPNVLEEVQSLLEQYPQLSYIGFCDDTLVTRPDRVLELCEGLKKIRATRDFTWYCEADVMSLHRHPEILPVMIDAGLVRLQIGIESGDDRMLEIYEKRLTADLVREAVKYAYDCGLKAMVGPLLIGAPFENPEHIELEKRWVEELIRLAPGMIEVPGSIIIPYPQTRIGQDPARYGYIITDAAGDGANSDFPAYHTQQMTEKEILAGYHSITQAGVLTARAVIEEGLVPYERLKAIVEIHKNRKSGFWGNLLSSIFPMIYTYFQLTLSCGIPPLGEVGREELAQWHIQRTFEIWRFVNVSGSAPKIGAYVLSPYEYQLILFCAGKLTVKEISNRMYDRYSGGGTREEFLNRIMDTLLLFEKKYWVVGVPF